MQPSEKSPLAATLGNLVGAPLLKRLFSYANLVGFLLPGALFSAILLADLAVALMAFEQPLTVPKVEGESVPYNLVLTLAIALLIFGWLMYLTKFYRFFPGYEQRKEAFRKKIAEVFLRSHPPAKGNGADEVEDKDKIDIGRFLYARTWKLIEPKDRNELLQAHVKWVALVHLTNGLVLSLIAQLLVVIWLVTLGALSPSVWPLVGSIVVQLLLFLYFRTAAVERIEDCDRLFFEKLQLFDKALQGDNLTKRLLDGISSKGV